MIWDFSIYFRALHSRLAFCVLPAPQSKRKILPQLLGNKFIDCITNGKYGIAMAWHRTGRYVFKCWMFECNQIHGPKIQNFFSFGGKICKIVIWFGSGVLVWHKIGCNFSGYIVDFWLVLNCRQQSAVVWTETNINITYCGYRCHRWCLPPLQLHVGCLHAIYLGAVIHKV